VIEKARMMGEGRPRRGKVGDEVEIGRDLEAGSESRSIH
jgi:hypothetical protein